MIQLSLLAKFQGWKTLITNGLVFVSAMAVAVGVIDTPISAVEAQALTGNAEAVLYAAENLQNVEAISAGAVAAVALLNFFLRFGTKTPVGKKTL